MLESLDIKENTKIFITGNTKDNIFDINNYQNICIVRFKDINIFEGETVGDILSYGLENKKLKRDEILKKVKLFSKDFLIDNLLDKDPFSLDMNQKVLMKICSNMITNPKIFIIDDSFDYLDYKEKKLVIKEFNNFIKTGKIVIICSNNIENSLYCDRVIINNDNKIIADGSLLEILNEEKLLKRLGYGLPFIVELSSYLKDYELINKYYLTNKSLVEYLWK